MASKYLMDAVKGYDAYLLKHGLDESVLQAYVLATQTAYKDEKDIRYGKMVAAKAKQLVNDMIRIQTGGTFAQLEEYAQENKTDYKILDTYYDILKIEARDILDSYMLYVEKNRKRRERFYEPRRKTLKLVTD